MSSIQEFLDKLSGRSNIIQQQQQASFIPSTVNNPQLIEEINRTNLTDLLTSVKGLFKVVKSRHWEPRTFYVCNGTPLNNATDGAVLASFIVPSNKIFVITNMDLVRTATGSYRMKCKWGAMGDFVDFIEDTSTHTHWYGYLVLDPGTVFAITQGATVSGTGNLKGSIGGLVFDLD